MIRVDGDHGLCRERTPEWRQAEQKRLGREVGKHYYELHRLLAEARLADMPESFCWALVRAIDCLEGAL